MERRCASGPPALIAIADPRFQQELEDFAVRSHYLEREDGWGFRSEVNGSPDGELQHE
jgi:acyl-CoA hydrolase